MKAKEKAKELWRKYAEADITLKGEHGYYKGLKTQDAKQCALIAVDEIINECDKYFEAISSNIVKFWLEVKEEINNIK